LVPSANDGVKRVERPIIIGQSLVFAPDLPQAVAKTGFN
jgi:hypothetical protein